jgi:hypothetical protein
MSESITPPDIKTTRFRVVIGAVIPGGIDKVLTMDPDCKVAQLRFTEDTAQVSDQPDYECNMLMDFQHGTVDEMVEDFRRKLTIAFRAWTYSNPDGTGPCAGLSQERAEERWREISRLQLLLAESDCSRPDGQDAGVRFIPFTLPWQMKTRKLRKELAEAREEKQLLAMAGLPDAG